MAVSIDTVYQKVLALANKEQRGYITPQEFNLFADMAQKEIFEQYFYDINQWTRQHGNDHGYSDMLVNLEEKIGLFEHFAEHDNVTVLNGVGDVNLMDDLPNLYRIGGVYVKYPGHPKSEAIAISAKEFRLLEQSKLTKYSKKRPVYLRFKTTWSKQDRIKIFPYPVEDDGSSFDLSSDELATTPVTITSIISVFNYTGDGTDCYFAVDKMNEFLGYTYNNNEIIVVDVYRNGTIVHDDINFKIYNDLHSSSIGPNSGLGRIDPFLANQLNFEVGDTIQTSTQEFQTNKRNVKVDYTKNPLTPNWGYVAINEKALYNESTSIDFELHASEEPELIYKILKFAGVSLQKQDITAAGKGLETAQIQQEKQ